MRPLVSREAEGRISKLGVAHETVWREIQRGKLHPESPKAFNMVKKEIFGGYDSERPRYGFTVAASPLTSRMVLKGRFSLDF